MDWPIEHDEDRDVTTEDLRKVISKLTRERDELKAEVGAWEKFHKKVGTVLHVNEGLRYRVHGIHNKHQHFATARDAIIDATLLAPLVESRKNRIVQRAKIKELLAADDEIGRLYSEWNQTDELDKERLMVAIDRRVKAIDAFRRDR